MEIGAGMTARDFQDILINLGRDQERRKNFRGRMTGVSINDKASF